MKDRPSRGFRQTPWDGQPLQERTILLCAEQGLGDTFQFIRYVPLVRQRQPLARCSWNVRNRSSACLRVFPGSIN